MDGNRGRSIEISGDAQGTVVISGDGNVVVFQTSRVYVDREAATAPLGVNPYNGLSAFRESDADRFFGREELVGRLWKAFRSLYDLTPEEQASPRILSVLGPSGSGKSSVVRAGLIPELARRPLPGLERAQVGVFSPGSDPVEALAGILAQIATNDPAPLSKTREFSEQLRTPSRDGLYDGLRRIARLFCNTALSPLVLLVDQAEEMYSLSDDANERKIFIENVLHAASGPVPGVSTILTLRSDFLGATQEHPDFNRAIADLGFIVPTMNFSELHRAIAQPAIEAGHPLDERTVELLISQTIGREGALPLLQFALTRIWEGMSNGIPAIETLKRLNGVGGALADEAQSIYDRLDELHRQIARHTFLDLVQLDEDTRGTRRPVPIRYLSDYEDHRPKVDYVLRKFSSPAVRLITLSSTIDGMPTAEVTHEALFEHWQLLRNWISEGRDDIRLKQRLGLAAREWDESGRESGYLYHGARLAQIFEWSLKPSSHLSSLERAFIQASVESEVDNLFEVSPQVLPSVVDRLTGFGSWVEHHLLKMRTQSDLTDAQRRRLVLALLPFDPSLLEDVKEELWRVPAEEFLVFRDALLTRIHLLKDAQIDEFWQVFHDAATSDEKRFRSSCVLAALDSRSPAWMSIAEDVVRLLVRQNALHLSIWVESLRSVQYHLSKPLLSVLRDENEPVIRRDCAAFALMSLAGSDAELLASLISECTESSYEQIFRQITVAEHLQDIVEALKVIAQEVPDPSLSEGDRVRLGGRRAGAAITLQRLKEHKASLDIFDIYDDPESLTQFVHLLKARSLEPSAIIECLHLAENVHARFALLLGIGEFQLQQVAEPQRDELVGLVMQWYQADPSSAIHGATKWLLRSWGFSDFVEKADKALSAQEASVHREWAVRHINGDVMTFALLDLGSFMMGSPASEVGRRTYEQLHEVRLTRRFAVCDEPVTRRRFEQFLKATQWKDFPDGIERFSPDLDCPVVCVTWYEAVAYCRWLSECVGLKDSDQCYESPDKLRKGDHGFPLNWPLFPERSGFRLLTEAEWEYACRSSTGTAYSFGSDRTLLKHYAWFVETTYTSQPAGRLRPNLRGLFDMHGNVYEWCHDWVADYPPGCVTDPLGPTSGKRKILRGGGWNYYGRDCRSADRYNDIVLPTYRYSSLGFRIGYTLGESELLPAAG
ncbi:MAG TPA: SUMF1/EgtB/PvdO family nonheme iron enzyme [Anaerolineae bacterium]|nr:SUMF1/EgtB/PvdO family nonheme iron enzyme [Anaerolineae bacterium]